MSQNELVLLGQVVGGVLVLAGTWLTARLGTRAANRKTDREAEASIAQSNNDAGHLALDISKELRGELKEIRAQLAETNRKADTAERRVNRLVEDRRRVQEWWEKRHYPWDLHLLDVVKSIEPSALENPRVVYELPPLEPLPAWRDDDV